MKVVIIGGVAGGASAAARLRRLDESADIVMLERSGYVSYANCGLPYYIGGAIEDRSDLTLQTPESFRRRFRVDARVRQEVTAIDRASKTVFIRDLKDGGEYTEKYDKLILAPGAKPVKPHIPGIDGANVYTLRTVEDALRIREKAVTPSVRSAAVIGGGFVGVEAAENLRRLGLDVVAADARDQVLGQIDRDMACFVHAHLREKGVRLLLGQAVRAFEPCDGGVKVTLDAAEIRADMAILAIGVLPESSLAEAAGLKLGPKGSVIVNDRMQTSDPDIYAVGDAVSIFNLVSGNRETIALAGPANKQGRVAADNIAGLTSDYNGSAASSVLKVFDMTVASTGLNENAAKKLGLDYEKIIISPSSHASYYPGGKVMTIKMLFEKGSERILGAQIVGFDGVDKRIDVISTAMQAGMKATALSRLDLAYAPPYSSAKDPVNMLGFVAENAVTGKVKHFYYEDLASLPRDGSVTLLDTRTTAEHARGYAEGFDLNIPVDELRERLGELYPEKPVYVMCQSGLRSYIACRILAQNGFDCYNFAGGYRFYAGVRGDLCQDAGRTSCGM